MDCPCPSAADDCPLDPSSCTSSIELETESDVVHCSITATWNCDNLTINTTQDCTIWDINGTQQSKRFISKDKRTAVINITDNTAPYNVSCRSEQNLLLRVNMCSGEKQIHGRSPAESESHSMKSSSMTSSTGESESMESTSMTPSPAESKSHSMTISPVESSPAYSSTVNSHTRDCSLMVVLYAYFILVLLLQCTM